MHQIVPRNQVIPRNRTLKKIFRQRTLLAMLLPAFLLTLIFHYLPIGGIVIAFKRYSVGKGIWGSKWVGLKWFIQFLEDPYAGRLIGNTLMLGLLNILIMFPAPIILALLFNELGNQRFKRVAQSISYIPHFISTIIIVGMMKTFMSSNGMINNLIAALGGERIIFFAEPEWFRALYVGSGIWQGLGWGTIIYLAALAGVSPELYEAATIDGANRWHKVIYVTIPAIMPTVITLFILGIPGLINVDTQKILLMQSPQTYATSDVIGTYVYREGIESANYSYSAAIDLMLGCASFVLMFVTNAVSRRISENSLW